MPGICSLNLGPTGFDSLCNSGLACGVLNENPLNRIIQTIPGEDSYAMAA